MNHHTLAIISITGSCLDVLGSLYLAYDLLGGKHGPLRLLTRIVTYSIFYCVGSGLGLGLFFGLVAGLSFGITSAVEMNRPARGLSLYPLRWTALFAVIRGISFGVGLFHLVGLQFAAIFALVITVVQLYGYSRGIGPAMDYSAVRRPRLTRHQLQGTIYRTFSSAATALFCGLWVHPLAHPWAFAIRAGLTIGIVSGVGQSVNPYIEYYADNLPPRWMGVLGIGLILCGFLLQSTQYWLQLFDVHLT